MTHGRRMLTIATLLAAIAATGCRSRFERHRDALGAMHARGQYEAAEAMLANDEGAALYGPRNELLYRMDRGSVEFAVGDTREAILQWNAADDMLAQRRTLSADEAVGSFLLNDNARPYLGEPYEDMYLNVFKMLAQLEARNVVGGATVEARRMAIKANQLRDRYARLADGVFTETNAPTDLPEDAQRILDLDSAGQFVESPLGLLLSVATFLHAGEPDNQRVAARRLQESLRAQGDLVGDVDPDDFLGVGELAPQDASLIVVAFSGRGPRKEAFRFPPIIIDQVPIYFELPVVRWSPSAASSARLVITDESTGDERLVALDRIENLGRVAEVNHKRQLPLIYARTFVRAAAKSTGLAFAARAVEKSNDDDAGFFAALAGLGVLAATERADLRAWEFLPGQAHAALLAAPPGALRARIEWLAPSGAVVYASPERVIDPWAPGRPATLVEFFSR
ncbi:MAG: hypothetical protein ACF8QF_04685 [Phycisphaerales bacterium]